MNFTRFETMEFNSVIPKKKKLNEVHLYEHIEKSAIYNKIFYKK
jgi:hypothetical protein